LFPLDLLAARVDNGLVISLFTRFLRHEVSKYLQKQSAYTERERDKMFHTDLPFLEVSVEVGILDVDWNEFEKG
jgi:argininosuccinate synthase